MPFKTHLVALLLIGGILACQEPPHEHKIAVAAVSKSIDNTVVGTLVPTDSVPDYDTLDWRELNEANQGILVDIRYATSNNFMRQQIYDCGRCFLRPEAAKALDQAQQEFAQKGLSIKVFDCYRPKQMQQKLWDIKPDARFVTPPAKGSMHSRGAAVDLTLVDASGNELDMGTAYDFFGPAAYQTATNLPASVLENRRLLRETLAKYGFRHIRTEWWHYYYAPRRYPLADMLWPCPTGS
jgi:D-alanyl-D-alanine dipeptidase